MVGIEIPEFVQGGDGTAVILVVTAEVVLVPQGKQFAGKGDVQQFAGYPIDKQAALFPAKLTGAGEGQVVYLVAHHKENMD